MRKLEIENLHPVIIKGDKMIRVHEVPKNKYLYIDYYWGDCSGHPHTYSSTDHYVDGIKVDINELGLDPNLFEGAGTFVMY
jgi:hypothetical protein